jgi:hypothetical protein
MDSIAMWISLQIVSMEKTTPTGTAYSSGGFILTNPLKIRFYPVKNVGLFIPETHNILSQ